MILITVRRIGYPEAKIPIYQFIRMSAFHIPIYPLTLSQTPIHTHLPIHLFINTPLSKGLYPFTH